MATARRSPEYEERVPARVPARVPGSPVILIANSGREENKHRPVALGDARLE